MIIWLFRSQHAILFYYYVHIIPERQRSTCCIRIIITLSLFLSFLGGEFKSSISIHLRFISSIDRENINIRVMMRESRIDVRVKRGGISTFKWNFWSPTWILVQPSSLARHFVLFFVVFTTSTSYMQQLGAAKLYIYLSLYELFLLLLLHRLFSTLFKYILGRFLLGHFVFILPRGSNINPFGALLPALVG